MADKFTIKQNDTSPGLRYDLSLFEGQELTNASVQFHMTTVDRETVVVNAAAEVFSDADQIIQYNWSPADTAASGVYLAEFQVTFSDGSIETYPNDGYILVKITPDLA